MLRRDAAFFVARRSRPEDVYVLVLLAVVILPGLLSLAVAVAGRLSRRLGAGLHLLLIGVLVAATLAPPVDRAITSGWATVVTALAGGLAGAVLYRRFEPARAVLTVLAPAPLVFALLFLMDGTVRKVISPPEAGELQPMEVGSDTSVVFLLLDELPLAALMSAELGIERELFPNFARLADESHWFRNASGVHEQTVFGIPAMMTGQAPTDPRRLALAADHPFSVFSMLGPSHRMKVIEAVTDVCPPELLGGRARAGEVSSGPGFTERMRSLLSDLVLVQAHIVVPKELAASLPDVTANWGGFWGDEAGSPVLRDAEAAPPSGIGGAVRENRTAIFRRFIASIDDGREPTLYFLHSLYPHYTWKTLPSGRRYRGGDRRIGLSQGQGGTWHDDDWVTTQAYQRFLLQLGHLDGLLGSLIAELEAKGVYDRSLVVVAADHGVCLTPGLPRRETVEENLEDILRVPLFVKLPHQRAGTISDRNVSGLDILPTIADVLDIDLPWPVDGRSVFDEGPAPATKTFYRKWQAPIRVAGTPPDAWPLLDRRLELFGSRPGWDGVYAPQPRAEMVGRAVGTFSLEGDLDLEALIEGAEMYTAVDKSSGVVPSLLVAEVRTPAGVSPPAELAVSVNGVIRAVTRPFSRSAGGAEYCGILPDEHLRDGNNVIELFAVGDGESSPTLARIPLLTYWLHHDGTQESIVASDGSARHVVPGALDGHLNVARFRNNDLHLMGWAVDAEDREPAEEILVFVDDLCAFRGRTGVPKRRVRATARHDAARPSAFWIEVPREVLGEGAVGHIRVFAAAHGRVSELRSAHSARWISEVFYTKQGDRLQGSDGVSVPIGRGPLKGRLDLALVVGDLLRLSGWAADIEGREQVDRIVVLRDDEHVHSGATQVEREKIAARFGAESLWRTGFTFALPLQWFGDPPSGRVELFAIKDGRALALPAGQDAAWLALGLESAGDGEEAPTGDG